MDVHAYLERTGKGALDTVTFSDLAALNAPAPAAPAPAAPAPTPAAPAPTPATNATPAQ